MSAFVSMKSRRGSTRSPISVENSCRPRGVLDADLEQRAPRRVHRGLPQLLGVHLAQALVALDRAGPSCRASWTLSASSSMRVNSTLLVAVLEHERAAPSAASSADSACSRRTRASPGARSRWWSRLRTPPPSAGATILKPPCSLSGAIVELRRPPARARSASKYSLAGWRAPAHQLGLVAQVVLREADAFTMRVDDAGVALAVEHAEQPLVLRRLTRRAAAARRPRCRFAAARRAASGSRPRSRSGTPRAPPRS